LALVAVSIVEQRFRAVMAVVDGARVTEVSADVSVSRQSVHSWAGVIAAGYRAVLIRDC
jgi:hypothetical protein